MCSFVLNAADYGVSQKRERVFFIGFKECNDPFFEDHLAGVLKSNVVKARSIRELLSSLGCAGTELNLHTCTAKITFATNPVIRKSPFAGIYFNGQGRPIDVDGYANTLPASMDGNKTPIIDEEYLYGDATEDWVVGYHRALQDCSFETSSRKAPARLRRISIKEAVRIQSFPDNYVFYGNKGAIYTQIGNAVPYKLAR